MTCKELSGSVITLVIIAVAILLAITAIQYISWLTSEPIECIGGKVYEVTYEGNLKILDEQHGEICVVKEMK
jgi:hypothetical protein